MNRLKIYIDLAFCFVILPIMIALFPVERWLHNFPAYTVCVGIWLYTLYVANRSIIIPLLFQSRLRRRIGIMLIILSAIITGWISGIKLYEPKPFLFDLGITRRLPVFEQYQQCVWSLFVIVEFFSIALSITIEFASQRQKWLLNLVEEIQSRNNLLEENQKIRQALENSLRQIEQQQIQPNTLTTPSAESDTHIILKSGYKNVKIEIADILYIEAMENYVKVIRRDKPTIISQTSMKAMDEMLGSRGFIRTHRSYIVATQYVEKFTAKTLTLTHQSITLPIGRKYSPSVASALNPSDIYE